jgi:uncharacterized protein
MAAHVHALPPLPLTPPPIPAQTIRFCRTCGSPWDPTWMQCPRCQPAVAAAAGDPAFAAPAAPPAHTYDQNIAHVKSAVALYFVLLAVSIVTIVVALAQEGELGVAEDFATSAAFAGVTIAWWVKWRADVNPLLSRAAHAGWFAAAVGLSLVTFAVAWVVVEALVVGLGAPEIRYSDAFDAEGYGFGWVVLATAVLPAIFEEIAFRGVIQTALGPVVGPAQALFVTAAMFAILHLSIPSMPHLLLMGALLGWLRVRTGSLLPGMLMHFCHNLLVVALEAWEGPAA